MNKLELAVLLAYSIIDEDEPDNIPMRAALKALIDAMSAVDLYDWLNEQGYSWIGKAWLQLQEVP